jgi:hypothetical protein
MRRGWRSAPILPNLPSIHENFSAKGLTFKRENATAWWRFLFELAKIDLDGFFGKPVGQLEIFTDLAPFIAMLDGFFGMIVGFPEGILRVPDCFIDSFQCFHHSSNPFSR